MAEPNSWQVVPNSVLDQEKQSDLADSWAADQKAKIAQQWGDQQRLAVPPAASPVRDDWATGGNPAPPFAQGAADSSSASPPSPASAPSAAPDTSGLFDPRADIPATTPSPPHPSTGSTAPGPGTPRKL